MINNRKSSVTTVGGGKYAAKDDRCDREKKSKTINNSFDYGKSGGFLYDLEKLGMKQDLRHSLEAKAFALKRHSSDV